MKNQNQNRLVTGLLALMTAGLVLNSRRASGASVVFKVDMAVQTASGAFVPQNGDTVSAAGTFQGSSAWTADEFVLTNVPGTQTYQGTYEDANSNGTLEGYKFILYSTRHGSIWEQDFGTNATGNNRIFKTTGDDPQTLPLVYFNDLAPASGVPTSPVVFEVDMSAQIANGNFNPANGDTVEARGTFQTPGQWAGGFTLTNSPAHPDLYTGNYPDANYPGTYEGFKFDIVSGGNTAWETAPNRGFTLQTNGQVLPVYYFNQQLSPNLPVTFQVDMSVEVLLGNFNPANDYVEAQGTFQTAAWNGGFTLTNNPQAANPCLYSGTYADLHGPGTVEEYKFVVDGGANLGWESPVSTGGNDRSFSLADAGQTLPVVYFSDLSSATPVTFQVDLGPQIGSGNYNPDLGDVIEARGSFNGWYGGFVLTNIPGSTIYQNTWMDTTDPTGGNVQYKYFIAHGGNDYDPNGYEVLDNNRSFPLIDNPVTLPLVYYGDQAPAASGSPNTVTFQVDMSLQIALGNFQPAQGDIVSVAGTFQSPSQWTAGVFQLTNSGVGDIYAGTYANDGNYPASLEEYKFIITSSGGDNWESLPNREFTLTNGMVLPVVYFNDQSSTIPVTFQVDMSVEILAGKFNPLSDYVEAKGTFQGVNAWSGAFVLTNNPAAANPNLYSGTYLDPNGGGTVEAYKFVVDGGANLGWEHPASTGGNDRTFTVNASGQTLPVVSFNDQVAANTLLQDTTVTFTVNMANAVDIFGNPFDPANDYVMIDGDFTNPQWPVLGNASDPYISSDYPNNVLQNNPPGSLLYTGSFLVPAGSPLQVTYKYGIYHNVSAPNTNVDNEAVYGQNHVRSIRSTGSYNFPMDTFGVMLAEGVINGVVRPDDSFGVSTALNPNGDQLSFSLAPGAPAGAGIDPATGVFSWNPGRAYASTTNYITVYITDATVPALSTVETLVVTVLDYLEVAVGSTAMLAGQSTNLPITLASSDGITNLILNVNWPGGRLLNPVLTSVPASAASLLQNQTTNLLIQVWTLPGQVLTGTNQIAQLSFQAAPGQASAFLNTSVSSLAGTKPGATAYVNNLMHSSEVVVVGENPLLRPRLSSSFDRTLDLFGNPGMSYQIQYRTNLLSPAGWQSLLNYSQTNVQQSVNLDAADPVIFYRLLQQ